MKELNIKINFLTDRELDMLLNVADSGLVATEDLIDISIYSPEDILPAVKGMREAHGMVDSIPEYRNLFYHYTGEYDDFGFCFIIWEQSKSGNRPVGSVALPFWKAKKYWSADLISEVDWYAIKRDQRNKKYEDRSWL